MLCTQKSSSKYLDGKRRHSQYSKFRLVLPSGPDPYLDPGPGESAYGTQAPVSNNPFMGRNSTYLGKTTLALHSCLQPPSAAASTSRLRPSLSTLSHTMGQSTQSHTQGLSQTRSSAGNQPPGQEDADQGDGEEREEEDRMGRAKATLRESLLKLHKDEQLAEWQEFCVNTVTVTKRGAHMSLPVLNRGFTGEGGGGGSTSSSAKGKLVLIPSVLDYEVKGPSSYLDLYTTKSKIQHNYNQHKK